MAAIDDVKAQLRVTHALEDGRITRLIDSAFTEFLSFTGLAGGAAPASVADMPADAFNGVVLMVQADYEGDPLNRNRYVSAARTLWQPYRVDHGV